MGEREKETGERKETETYRHPDALAVADGFSQPLAAIARAIDAVDLDGLAHQRAQLRLKLLTLLARVSPAWKRQWHRTHHTTHTTSRTTRLPTSRSKGHRLHSLSALWSEP